MHIRDLYRGFTRQHGVYRLTGKVSEKGKAEGRALTVKGAPSDSAWETHLAGSGPGLGIIPLCDDNETVWWGAIDIDVYPLDIDKLARDAAGLPLVLTRSKSKGVHCWLFLREPAPAKLVMEKLAEWAAALGFGGVEVFPKQSSRVGDEDVGNWINLPYYGNGRRAFHQGKELELADFLALAEKRRITVAQLESIKVESDDEFADGPPCLQMCKSKGFDGWRNNVIFQVAIYLRFKYPDEWEELTLAWNREHCRPPLDESEVKQTCKSISRKEGYHYSCKKQPFDGFCNRKVCRKREFGIAHGREENDGEVGLDIGGLTKLATQPPRWWVNVMGVRVEIPTTADLLSMDRFEVFCVNTVHKTLPSVKKDVWKGFVQGLLDGVEVVEAPAEASVEGQFFDHLVQFIDIRGQSEARDLVANGQVYIDDAKVAYFRAQDFFLHLKRQGFRDFDSPKMYALLRERGLLQGRWNVKGKTVPWWSLQTEGLQSEAFDPPQVQDPF